MSDHTVANEQSHEPPLEATPAERRESQAVKPVPRPPSDKQRILKERPLLDPDTKLMILWSPKSACTSTFVWFLGLIGKREEARAYHEWPHKYRTERYYQSGLYKQGIEIPLSEYRMVRVIRDPYTRAVSSYRHVLAREFADKMLLKYDPSMDREQGFSFQTYLNFLSTVDIRKTDPHLGCQYRTIEDLMQPFEVINVSKKDLFESLNAIEDRLGLARVGTDFDADEWLRKVEDGRRAVLDAFEGPADEVPLNTAAARGNLPWPPHAALLTPRAKQLIEQIYAIDFKAYAPFL